MTKTQYNEQYIKALEKQSKDLAAYIQELERERDGLAESYHGVKVDCASHEARIKSLERRNAIAAENIVYLKADNSRLRQAARDIHDLYRDLLAKCLGGFSPEEAVMELDEMDTAGPVVLNLAELE
jgi:chromosome segregation ATPase